MFGTYDQAQLQRGFQVYREVCSNCHALSIPFRALADPDGPGYSEDQVKTLAASYQVTNAEPNDKGEIFKRPGHAGGSHPAPGSLSQRSGRGGGARQGAAGHEPPRQGAQVRAGIPMVHLRRAARSRVPGSGLRLHLRDPQRLHQAGRSAVESLLSRPQDRDAAADHGRRGQIHRRHRPNAQELRQGHRQRS